MGNYSNYNNSANNIKECPVGQKSYSIQIFQIFVTSNFFPK